MTVDRDPVSKKIKYYYTSDIDQKAYTYRAEQIFHIVGLSYDGIIGISPIDQVREAVGLALATEEFGARFFGNGAKPLYVRKEEAIYGHFLICYLSTVVLRLLQVYSFDNIE